MENDKQLNNYRLGLGLLKIIEENKALPQTKNQQSPDAVNSLRKLAASSGVEFSIIQKISSGKRNPSFSTVINLLEGLNLTLTEFAAYYDSISDKEVNQYKQKLELQRAERLRKSKRAKGTKRNTGSRKN
jgi:transcriptional regulator with XRE-family HTH domain